MNKTINICCLYGRIISDIEFNFFYNSKWHNSQVEFYIEIDFKNSTRELSNQKLYIKGYDDIADILYKYYHKDDYIQITGIVTSEGVEVNDIIRG
ncbi:MAG: hypothetical protein IJ223_04410 [Clostridia bacterium]|nr:hypothetical protein [Clostridia bacterium]